MSYSREQSDSVNEFINQAAELAGPPAALETVVKGGVALGTTGALMLGVGPSTAGAYERNGNHITVESGDTMFEIAADNDTTVAALLANPDNSEFRANPDRIFPGQVIEAEPLWAGESVHHILPGETLTEIADHYGVSVSDLAERNGIPNPDRIIAMSRIVVPARNSEPTPLPARVVLETGGTFYEIAEDIVEEAPQIGTPVDVARVMLAWNQVENDRTMPAGVYTIPGLPQDLVERALTPEVPVQVIVSPSVVTETAPSPANATVITESTLVLDTDIVPLDRVFDVATVQQILPAASPDNIAQYTPLLDSALKEQGIGDLQMMLYGLSTVSVETPTFEPIHEYASGDAYEGRRDLGNIHPGDGRRFRGRGFVQLTGRSNYQHMSDVLGIDLINNPDLALEPATAARIMAVYFAEREDRIRQALAAGDMAAARRVVNGGINGLDGFSNAFNVGLGVVEGRVQAVLNQQTSRVVEPVSEVVETPVASWAQYINEESRRAETNGFESVEVGGIRVRSDIGPQLAQMIEAAAADGISLTGDGFRTYEEQVALRIQNCGDTQYEIYEMPSRQCTPDTARPGQSNHEQGLAIDFDINDAVFNWLKLNAERFGFSNYQPEPWHWSTTGQ